MDSSVCQSITDDDCYLLNPSQVNKTIIDCNCLFVRQSWKEAAKYFSVLRPLTGIYENI